MKMYPIMDGPSVPWDYMAPHESQAKKNHGQTLAELADRGGLSALEAECIANGVRTFDIHRDCLENEKQAWFHRAERVNRDWGNSKEQPLTCKIEGQQLVIRIGIDTLAFVAEHCPKFFDYEKHVKTGPPYASVLNPEELASDVCSMLQKEEEDGTTPLHILIDDAIEAARDDGSLAFAEDE